MRLSESWLGSRGKLYHSQSVSLAISITRYSLPSFSAQIHIFKDDQPKSGAVTIDSTTSACKSAHWKHLHKGASTLILHAQMMLGQSYFAQSSLQTPNNDTWKSEQRTRSEVQVGLPS
jgi:hypothetical protein